MRSYKLVLLLKSDLTKEKKKKVLEQIESWAGAKDVKVDELGEKKLSYVIKKEKKGDYVAVSFGSEKIETDFEKRLVVNESILRHLMIRVK
jgi:ribosomal protein S6